MTRLYLVADPPSVERHIDFATTPVQRVWLELADAQQRRQTVRVALLSAALHGVAKGSKR